MKKIINLAAVTLLLSLILPNLLIAQPEVEWESTYGGAGNQGFSSVISTREGGFAMGGSIQHETGDFWLVVTDGQGEELWSRGYDLGGNEHCAKILQTDDLGFVLAGTIWLSEASARFMVLKVDAEGEEVWRTNFGRDQINELHILEHTHDGGFLIAGSAMNAEFENADLYAVKVDGNGEFVWHQAYMIEHDQYCMASAPAPHGAFMIAGYSVQEIDLFTRRNDVFLIKIAQNGNRFYHRIYETETWDLGIAMTNTNDNGYAIAGFTALQGSANLFLMRLDDEANLQWRQDFPHEGTQYCSGLARTREGGFALVGSNNAVDQNEDSHLYRVTENGEFAWEMNLGGAGRQNAVDIISNVQGGYLMAGFSQSDGYLVLTGADPVGVGTDDGTLLVEDFALAPAYPNPFNSTTTITYTLPCQSNISLQIYNTRGQLVNVLLDQVRPAGRHNVVWEAAGTPAGVYLVRMMDERVNILTNIQKVVLVR